MKNKNKYIGIMNILILSLLLSCDKFEEINTNPDTPTKVSASMLCTNVILSVTKFNGQDAKGIISANALAKYVGYANEGQMDAQYNKIGSSGFGGMTVLPNIEKMIEYAQENVAENSYKGVGKFARAYMFYGLTMQMGDIPYSETGKGADGLYKPKYDLQENIFKGILDELKEAEQYFATDEANGRKFDGDPTPYNGDPAMWRRAVNSFSLKVLMTLSKKTGVASLDIINRFAEIVTGDHLFENPTDFYGLEYSIQDPHPLYSTNDLFTSRTVISSLLINNLKMLNDRRMYYIADPAVAEINGGKTETDPDAYVGVDVDINYAVMNAYHSLGRYSLLNLRYQKEQDSESRMLITYGEQQLILAEARILGWISTGSAQTYYEEGVKAALTQMMNEGNPDYAHGMAIDTAYINGYFTGEAAFKATTEDQLKQIWLQRYVLNFMQDALSSFYEYRRNTYPDFPINPATSLNNDGYKDKIPMRWLYPGSESTYNRENLTDALDRQYDGYDEINKLMWLLK